MSIEAQVKTLEAKRNALYGEPSMCINEILERLNYYNNLIFKLKNENQAANKRRNRMA